MKRPVVLLCVLMALIGSILQMAAPAATAEPTVAAAVPDQTHPGSWEVLNCPGINPIHSGMLPSGNILMVAGSGYDAATFAANQANPELKLYKAWIYDPNSGECPREIPLPQDKDLFCAGMTSLPDGRMLFFGGTGKYGTAGPIGSPSYYHGIRDTYVFDEATEAFTKVDDMAVARWYGQAPVDSAGRPVAYSGLDEVGALTNKVERFNTATNTWTSLPSTPTAVPMYAGTVLLPSGNFAYTGTYFGTPNGHGPKVLNPTTGTYGQGIAGLAAPNCRDQGLTLKNQSQVAVIGGGCPGSATSAVSLLDLTKPTLAFTTGPALGYAAQHLCGAVLPDRSYFVSGGSVENKVARYEARRLVPGGTAWQTLAAPTVPRQYHSTCLPLLDGRVVTMGTNYPDGGREFRIETYTPWYAQGQGLVRPNFLTLSATSALNGARVNASNDYAQVKNVTLTKLPTSTHSSDPNQLTWTVPNDWGTSGQVSFQVPGGAITPPGKYMLSLLDWRGVPTVSKVFTILEPAAPARKVAAPGSGGPAGAVPCCPCCP